MVSTKQIIHNGKELYPGLTKEEFMEIEWERKIIPCCENCACRINCAWPVEHFCFNWERDEVCEDE